MHGENLCPLCLEVGREGRLSLRQINAAEAVYVCSNPQCPYPVGVSTLEESLVERHVPELEPEQKLAEVIEHSSSQVHANATCATTQLQADECAELEKLLDMDLGYGVASSHDDRYLSTKQQQQQSHLQQHAFYGCLSYDVEPLHGVLPPPAGGGGGGHACGGGGGTDTSANATTSCTSVVAPATVNVNETNPPAAPFMDEFDALLDSLNEEF